MDREARRAAVHGVTESDMTERLNWLTKLTHFISQSYPDIQRELKKAEEGPGTSQRDLLNLAFKIFNNLEEQAKLENAQRDQASATALHGSKPQSSDREKKSSRPCYKCGKEGHWACSCPKPRPPLGPSPNYGIKGHWKVDCPHLPLGIQTLPSGPKEESLDPALPRLLGLTTEDQRCSGPQAPTLITSMEPRVTLTMAGKQISFLINTGATYSAMPAYSGKTEVSQISVVGVDDLVPTPQII